VSRFTPWKQPIPTKIKKNSHAQPLSCHKLVQISAITNSLNFLPARAFSSTPSNNEEVEIFVDGKSVKIEQGAALIQACEKAGADVS
jgi:hypothetical protein